MNLYVIGFVILAGITVVGGVYVAGEKAKANELRVETLTKSVKIIKQRDGIVDHVKTADEFDICRVLGGKWLPDVEQCSDP